MSTRHAWQWQAVSEPAEPGAAVAWGKVAQRLHERLADLPAERQARLQLTANRDVLIAIGPADDLPWVDGIAYAHAAPEAPGLWLPTHWRPDIPTDLVLRALQAAHGRQPLLLWRTPAALVPLDRQLPLNPALLARVARLWNGR
ncbi:hypothetical protein FNU76_12015 [Chitinimonas arctica]|uniref:MoxR-vWA-beta-propeller ternary system domain-containing protein n=1 Tax=Chitinimonas arctica TaxID=2594795 RepID=A0A516SFT5_9NEIS|nr:hypothetical protein [Chitinimonas arctica]QDQ27027.1 hypothetical protein FNU76_12015 [Chitinimonas arctica]